MSKSKGGFRDFCNKEVTFKMPQLIAGITAIILVFGVGGFFGARELFAGQTVIRSSTVHPETFGEGVKMLTLDADLDKPTTSTNQALYNIDFPGVYNGGKCEQLYQEFERKDNIEDLRKELQKYVDQIADDVKSYGFFGDFEENVQDTSVTQVAYNEARDAQFYIYADLSGAFQVNVTSTFLFDKYEKDRVSPIADVIEYFDKFLGLGALIGDYQSGIELARSSSLTGGGASIVFSDPADLNTTTARYLYITPSNCWTENETITLTSLLVLNDGMDDIREAIKKSEEDHNTVGAFDDVEYNEDGSIKPVNRYDGTVSYGTETDSSTNSSEGATPEHERHNYVLIGGNIFLDGESVGIVKDGVLQFRPGVELIDGDILDGEIPIGFMYNGQSVFYTYGTEDSEKAKESTGPYSDSYLLEQNTKAEAEKTPNTESVPTEAPATESIPEEAPQTESTP